MTSGEESLVGRAHVNALHDLESLSAAVELSLQSAAALLSA